ncbi:SMI1/KNR4 family protein [cf. Phormidesmis sp. LEGE 11477]|uniref:SMI1/KNR4 family protein n=1 Tax=cf. Phormidesmis sp. LEGE 11477 TaxID=1828680 RepID=UPI00188042DD|nr:SMI1/KNR4 family protein [cf. Phormidesmis sp. LEGE 11477]MBE9064321.1 SMI1/KNR4 family protein [cf. Phormidesmis sp. LEGE 11477]
MLHFDRAFIDMVRSHPKSKALLDKAPLTPILVAESMLGHTLPPSYKEFLSQLNGGAFSGIQLFGIDRGDHLDFILQLAELSSFIPSVEARIMIPFARDWGGSIYCFDTYHPAGDGEYPIWYWNHEYSEEPADAPYVWFQVETDFVTFIYSQFSQGNGR